MTETRGRLGVCSLGSHLTHLPCLLHLDEGGGWLLRVPAAAGAESCLVVFWVDYWSLIPFFLRCLAQKPEDSVVHIGYELGLHIRERERRGGCGG